MSRYYEMDIYVRDFDEEQEAQIETAIEENWNVESIELEHATTIWFNGKDSLFGGESEEEFTRRVSIAVWAANEGFCKVRVTATYLEDLPNNTHELTEENFKEMLEKEPNLLTKSEES
jgi:hypothetical protein